MPVWALTWSSSRSPAWTTARFVVRPVARMAFRIRSPSITMFVRTLASSPSDVHTITGLCTHINLGGTRDTSCVMRTCAQAHGKAGRRIRPDGDFPTAPLTHDKQSNATPETRVDLARGRSLAPVMDRIAHRPFCPCRDTCTSPGIVFQIGSVDPARPLQPALRAERLFQPRGKVGLWLGSALRRPRKNICCFQNESNICFCR